MATATAAPPIPPVFVLSTGRCGSTMISDILNRHPRVLSLSEFWSFNGLNAFTRRRRAGEWIWRLCSAQQARTRLMLRGDFEELLYPFNAPNARFTRESIPPIMCATLPHITPQCESLYDELAPVVREWPRRSPADHYRLLFGWLCQRFRRDVWVERSGGSLLSAYILMRRFPEARIIHVYRDGRDVALSMSRHYLFRMIVASLQSMRPVNLLKLLPRDRLWELLMVRLIPLISKYSLSRQLPYDRLQTADFAAFWNVMIEHANRLFRQLPATSLLNVKFEDVQSDPEPQIRRLIRFISPDLEDAAWLQAACAIPRPTQSRFPRLPPDEQARITEACRPGLERLGYSA